jgi:UDP-glucose 4-epimerase
MKIIITGVAGFIGSNLAKKLIREGHEVTGIDNLSYGSLENIKSFRNDEKFMFIEGDILNDDRFLKEDADILVHLASQKIPRYTNAFRTISENSEMTKLVAQKCVNQSIKLVFASTSDIYGKNPEVPYNENSNSVLGDTTIKRWAYAISKLHSEHYIIGLSEEKGFEYTIMRFFGSYGPNQNRTWWGGPQSVFMEKILNDEELEIHGDGSQTRTFTFIEDTIQGIVKCMFHENSKNQVFNIASDSKEEITIKDLALLISELMNPGELPKLKLIPYSSFGKYEDVMRRVPDISKIKEMLEYEPKFSLKDGLIQTIEWQSKLHAQEQSI